MNALLIDYNPNWGLNYVDNAVTSAVADNGWGGVFISSLANEGQCRGYTGKAHSLRESNQISCSSIEIHPSRTGQTLSKRAAIALVVK